MIGGQIEISTSEKVATNKLERFPRWTRIGTSDLCIIPPPAPISLLIVIIIHQFIHLWQMQLLSSWKFYNQSSNEMFRASIWIYNYWIKSLKLEKHLTAQMISRIDLLENLMFFCQKLAAVAELIEYSRLF